MTRDRFTKLVADVLDSLPSTFRDRISNLAVLVEDRPKHPRRPHPPRPSKRDGSHRLVLGTFEGVPNTQKSVFDLAVGPDRIVLYQRNIEAICSSEAEIHHEVRQTVLHELGHYFGMNEGQLNDVQLRFFIPACRMAAFSFAALDNTPLTSFITASIS